MPRPERIPKRNDLYDIFISHASEDKNSYVRPLAEELQRLGLLVWYDEFSLRPGDSVREAIDQGLTASWHGLLVISKAFIAKKWTHWEVNALVQSCIGHKSRRLIPIWLGVNYEDVLAWSPPIADLKSIVEPDPVEAAHRIHSAIANDRYIVDRNLSAENSRNIQIMETLDAAARLLCNSVSNVDHVAYRVHRSKQSISVALTTVSAHCSPKFGDTFDFVVKGRVAADLINCLAVNGPLITASNGDFQSLIYLQPNRPTRKALLALPLYSNSSGILDYEPLIDYVFMLLAPEQSVFKATVDEMIDIARVLGSVFHSCVNTDPDRDDEHVQIGLDWTE